MSLLVVGPGVKENVLPIDCVPPVVFGELKLEKICAAVKEFSAPNLDFHFWPPARLAPAPSFINFR